MTQNADQPGPATRSKWARFFGIVLVIVAADQATKAWIVATLALYDGFTVIPGLFNIVYVHNTGGAFGLFATHASWVRILLFVVMALAASGMILWMHAKTPPGHPWFATALALVFGGAVGNLIDRVRLGYVVDFLDFHLKGHHWPAFNVADSAVTVGVALLAFFFLFQKDPL